MQGFPQGESATFRLPGNRGNATLSNYVSTDRVKVGPVEVQLGNSAAAIDAMRKAAELRDPVSFKFVNAYSIALADREANYRGSLAYQSVNFPDGTPVAWLASALRSQRGPRQKAVRGPEVFERALLGSALSGARHYFLGASPETLEKLNRRLRAEAPLLQVAGSWSPPYLPLNEMEEEIILRIREANPDIVWLGLGTPKQDLLAARIVGELGIPTAGVGAAFDFFAGTVAEAPRFLRGSGLEWLYRLLSEPRRLWRRYTIWNLRYCLIAFRTLRDHRAAGQDRRG